MTRPSPADFARAMLPSHLSGIADAVEVEGTVTRAIFELGREYQRLHGAREPDSPMPTCLVYGSPRLPGCRCHWEEGDRPCPLHPSCHACGRLIADCECPC